MNTLGRVIGARSHSLLWCSPRITKDEVQNSTVNSRTSAHFFNPTGKSLKGTTSQSWAFRIRRDESCILIFMDTKSAVLSEVMTYQGLRFQWLVLFDASDNAVCKTRIGVADVASDWSEIVGTVHAEDWAQFPTIFPDMPLSLCGGEIDKLLEHTTADRLKSHPLPGWKPVDWFAAGLPVQIPVSVSRRFTELR